jgi:uncharacterized protein YkwD
MIPRRRAIAILAASVTSTLALSSQTSAQGSSGARANASEKVLRALERINGFRSAAGVPPSELHPALMQSANGHVAYYDRNKYAGAGLHEQVPGKPGFTGVTMSDRARAAGYTSSSVTENAGFGGLAAAVEWAMISVSHRLPLIHPGALDMGLAESESSGFNVIAVGLRRGMSYAVLPSFFPSDGSINVPLRWDGGESPDPAPGVARPLGFPITVCFGLGQKVEWQALDLRGPDGARVDVALVRNDWMSAVALVPTRPLLPSARYSVTVTARVDGSALVREGRFSTGRA